MERPQAARLDVRAAVRVAAITATTPHAEALRLYRAVLDGAMIEDEELTTIDHKH